MKLLRLTLLLIFFLGASHALRAQEKEIPIKQVTFKLDQISDIEYENEYYVTYKFNKGSKYVFKITNGIDDAVGIAVMELMDADNLVLTNVYNDKYFDKVTFQCNKTGFYDLLIKFKDNKLGNSRIDISMLE